MKNKRYIVWLTAGFLMLVIGTVLSKAVMPAKPAAGPNLLTGWQAAMAKDSVQYDSALVKKFVQVLASVDFSKSNCHYSGVIRLTDGKDTASSIPYLKFRFLKRDSLIDYVFGNAEIINDGKLNILLDNDTHKIVVSSQKFNGNPPFTGVGKVISSLRSEHYSITQQGFAHLKKISIVNENHLACKEISLTYDPVDMQMKSIYTRTPDLGDPGNRFKERMLKIDFNSQYTSGTAQQKTVAAIIRKKDGGWVLTPPFSKYDLIILQ
jgi:hypothetical protein